MRPETVLATTTITLNDGLWMVVGFLLVVALTIWIVRSFVP